MEEPEISKAEAAITIAIISSRLFFSATQFSSFRFNSLGLAVKVRRGGLKAENWNIITLLYKKEEHQQPLFGSPLLHLFVGH